MRPGRAEPLYNGQSMTARERGWRSQTKVMNGGRRSVASLLRRKHSGLVSLLVISCREGNMVGERQEDDLEKTTRFPDREAQLATPR